MPQSVDKDGAVRGPAPQGYSNVTTFCLNEDTSCQQSETDGSRVATKSAPITTTNDLEGNVISLELDEKFALRAEISEINQLLSEAHNNQHQSERRLERACANLLISGERIPALDQSSFSMMQEAYLNASTAAIVGAEKMIILEEQISRLDQRLRTLLSGDSESDYADLPRAA